MEPNFDLSFDDLLAQIQDALPEITPPEPVVFDPMPTAENTEPATVEEAVAYEPVVAEEPAEPEAVEELVEEETTEAEEAVEYEPAPVEEPAEPEAVEEPIEEEPIEAEEAVEYESAPVEELAEPEAVEELVEEEPTEAEEEAVAYEPVAVEEPAEPETVEEPVADEPTETEQEEEPMKVFDPSAFTAPSPTKEEAPLSLFDGLDEPSEPEPANDTAATEKTIDISQTFPKKAEAEQPLTEEQADLARTQPITFRAMQDSPMFFERPGIVTGKSMFGKTGDLSAVPAIMAAEDALNRMGQPEQPAPKPKTEPNVEDTQMILPGFFAEPAEVVLVDDEEAENELKENRSQKVESFRLEGVEEQKKEINTEILDEMTESGGEGLPAGKRFSFIKARARANRQRVEYNRPQDKNRVFRFLNKKRTTTLVSTVISAVCCLGLLFTGAIPAVADGIDAGAAPQWLGNMPLSYFISLLLLIVCAFGGLPIYARGITGFFRGSGKPNACTAVFAALAASFVQLIAASLGYNGEKVPCFALLAALAVTLFGVGNLLSLDTIAKNFVFLSELDKNELYAADTIENAADIKRLAQDSVIGGTDIRYSAKAKFAANFLSYSFAGDSTDDLCAWLVPAGAAISFVIAVLVGLVKKDVSYAFSMFSCAMGMSVPVSAAIAMALPLSRADNQLRDDGAFLSSYAAAFEYETTNVVAVDASDLFPAECCDIHGMKPFGGVRIDEAILTAASMILAVGGPIGSLLSNVVMGRKELLMPVERLIYEDRLGLSGWIQNRCVVLGNRRMMENHNIEIPREAKEARYARNGRRVLYLADNGKLIALFVVSYGTDVRIAEQVRKIEENGINLLVRATDPNITEKSIAMTFGIPVSSIKVVSNAAGEVLTAYAERVNPRAEAKLVHNGSPLAFLHAVRSAGWLCGVAGRINAQQIACCATGLLIVAILGLLTASVSPLIACLCQLLWVVVGLAVPLFGRE